LKQSVFDGNAKL